MTLARWYDIAFFLALLSTAVALGAALAHALELPNKIGLSGTDYFIVQQAYRGWNRLAYLLIVECLSIGAVAVMSRGQPYVFWAAVAALGCLIAAQVVFWTFTYPANVATENWTAIPANWEELRSRWEYSHAAGAALQLLAMGSLIFAVLARGRT
jgi:hypothetical protein